MITRHAQKITPGTAVYTGQGARTGGGGVEREIEASSLLGSVGVGVNVRVVTCSWLSIMRYPAVSGMVWYFTQADG